MTTGFRFEKRQPQLNWTVATLALLAPVVVADRFAFHSGSAAQTPQGPDAVSQTSSRRLEESPVAVRTKPDQPPSDNPLHKTVLDQPHFKFRGCFRMPRSDGKKWSTSWSMGGLTHRYVKGELRFLTTSHVYGGGLVYETDDPGIGTADAPPQAKVVKYWGDIYSGHKWVGNKGETGGGLAGGVLTYGLYFDQKLDRLYWSYGDWYNATHPYNPSFGYSILKESNETATGIGSWSLANRPEKFARGGTLRIPQWFADRYTAGKSLGVGFGGYFSIVTSASLGPALAAVSDPDIKVNPDKSALKNIPLIGYPYNAPDRGHRDSDYTSFYDDGIYPTKPGKWNPSGKIGYWTWSDIIFGAATWIDLPSKGGVLFIAKVGRGKVWYEKSDRHAQSGAFEWLVYDPADLAAVASGAKRQWQIQPKHIWTDPALPLGPLDQSGWSGDGVNQVGGLTFDPTTNRLYVLLTAIWKTEVEYHPQIYVYQVE